MEGIRRSALEAFDGCPFRYDQVYNRGAVDQGDESHRGIVFHAAADAYIQRLAANQVAADHEDAVDAFKAAVAELRCPTHLIDEVDRLFFRWAEGFELDLGAYFTTEERQAHRGFTWRPDLVYIRPQGVEIRDWKTYYRGLTQAQAGKEFQARFYLTQAVDIWPGFPTYSFVFVFVRLNYEVRVTVTADQVDAWRPQVDAILAGIQEGQATGTWPAIPGSHCSLCRLACPIVDNPARLPVRLTTPAEAKEAAGQILALEQRLKALKKSLGGFCSVEGPLVLNGQEFAHFESQGTSYRLADVLAWARQAGVDLGDVWISGTPLKPAFAAVKGTKKADALKALGTKSPRWAFRHRKAGEPDAVDGKVDILAADEGGDE